jgi:DNA-binding ferritin-like protein
MPPRIKGGCRGFAMIEELISRVFFTRNVAHFAHWRATGAGSYAKHKALGKFYDGVIDALDPVVEAYQGAFELIKSIPAPQSTGSGDILKMLEADAAWIEKNHESICKGNRAIANLIDNLSGVYLSAIYKLRNLR